MNCPNLENCILIRSIGKVDSTQDLMQFKINYCEEPSENWKNCARYNTSIVLDFCPDFVQPNSKMTIDEIIDMYEIEIQ